MEQQNTNYNPGDINRHWLIWLDKNFVFFELPDQLKSRIQNHITRDLPFICARSNADKDDYFNLGYCYPSENNQKSGRYVLKIHKSNVCKFRPPLLISEAVVNLHSSFTEKLNNLMQELTKTKLPEPRIFGSYSWQSITGEQHIRTGSDLDLITDINSIEDMCLYSDIINAWEKKFNIRTDSEFCLDNNVYFNSKEFFDSSKQLIIKTRKSVDLVPKKELLENLQSKSGKSYYHSDYSFKKSGSSMIALLACKSLYSELAAYPKPGLVSFHDSGSHNDMNHTTFISSIKTLYEYFAKISDAVINDCSFSEMVKIGKEAEFKMLDATSNTNTHKGAIFSLGLLVAATVRTLRNNDFLNPESIHETLIKNWSKNIIGHSIPNITHGRKAVSHYKANGILKEASDGFPVIFDTALPCFKAALKETGNWNMSLVQTFFSILLKLDDTNLLHRGGEDALIFARAKAALFLNSGGVYNKDWFKNAEKIHRLFVEKRLSPGGCADMLACTVYLYYMLELKSAT